MMQVPAARLLRAPSLASFFTASSFIAVPSSSCSLARGAAPSSPSPRLLFSTRSGIVGAAKGALSIEPVRGALKPPKPAPTPAKDGPVPRAVMAAAAKAAAEALSSVAAAVGAVAGGSAASAAPAAAAAPEGDKCGPVPAEDDDLDDMVEMVDPSTQEWGGPTKGGSAPEPTRFGDWERKGRCTDFC